MFRIRDWLWLTALVAMAIAWQVNAMQKARAAVGQEVVILRYDPFHESVTQDRGMVSHVSPGQIDIDTSTSAPIRSGVVVSKRGQCLGIIADLPGKRSIALALPNLAK